MQKNEAIEKVAEWIEKGCDYTIGCSLFAIYGKNKTLSRIFPGRQQRYEGKLKYELCKAVGLTDAFLKMKAEETQETVSTNPPADGDKAKSGNEEDLPEEVKMVIAELSKLTDDMPKLEKRLNTLEGDESKELLDYIESTSQFIDVLTAAKEAFFNDKVIPNLKELFAPVESKNKDELPEEVKMVISELSKLTADRSKLHTAMSSIEGNDDTSVDARKQASDKIESLSNLIEILYAVKEAYFNDKVIPNIDELFSAKPALIDANVPEKEEDLPVTAEELKKQKTSIQRSLSKDKNLLEFQTETKQEKLNPMPEGPKRKSIEKRIAKKQKEIENINLKLVDLAG